MSFNDLIGLFIFLLFVAVPLLNRLLRRQRSQPGQQPTRPGTTFGQPPSAQDPTPAGEFEEDDPIGRRLEEARRRVEAARSNAASTAAPQQPQLQIPQPSAPPPLMSAPRPVAPDLGRASRPAPAPVRTPFAPQFGARVAAAPAPSTQSRPLMPRRKVRKARRRSQDPSETRHASPLLFDADQIVRGILWHQILSEPVAFDHLERRRTSSQRRSR